MRRLTNQIQPYAWGSRVALARLRGAPVPSAGPEAELWLGAHPSAPSRLEDGTPLSELLGGRRLPFLLKLLAAAQPLSIQAHPDPAQAQAGFAAGDPNYVDPFPKPELLVALEPFEALCGFADPAVSAARLAGLPRLAPAVAALADGDLRGATTTLLAADAATVGDVARADPFVARLAELYPGDPGCLVALLLNHVRLQPDQAVFMPAGNLHAYLDGFGVEIMVASDNVLRGGLTPKRVDVPALVAILRFEPLPDPVLRPVPLGPGLLTWPVPVGDFSLVKATGPATLPGGGPRIVVCVEGPAEMRWAEVRRAEVRRAEVRRAEVGRAEAGELVLRPGESVFVDPDEPAVEVVGGVVFQARSSVDHG